MEKIMDNKFINTLTTSFSDPNFTWENYPRPQLKRDSFYSLNGRWNLSLKSKNTTNFLGEITVPFPPESSLSNIVKTLKKGNNLFTKKPLPCPKTLIWVKLFCTLVR